MSPARVQRSPAVAFEGQFQAPVLGIDTETNEMAMDPRTTKVLTNWWVNNGLLRMRPGTSDWCVVTSGGTSYPGGRRLMPYTSLAGVEKLFLGTNANILDVTTSSASTVVGYVLGSSQHDYCNFGTAGANYLLAFTGNNTIVQYDGFSWTASTLTGPNTTFIRTGCTFKNRLFLIQNNQLSFWYGGAGAVSGAFVQFPLAGVAQRGGRVHGVATWTRDGGSGPDDLAVFITDQGEAIVYEGTDPASASSWGLVGVFYVGKPLQPYGRPLSASMVKYNGDLLIMTQSGIVKLSDLLSVDRGGQSTIALTARVSTLYRQLAFGVQACSLYLHPRYPLLVATFAPPVGAGTSIVIDLASGAASRWTGTSTPLTDGGFADLGGVVYGVTSNGTVATVTVWDEGSAGDYSFTATLQTAWQNGGAPEANKGCFLVRPSIQATAASNPLSIGLGVDFDFVSEGVTQRTLTPSPDQLRYSGRHPCAGMGRYFAMRMTMTNQPEARFLGATYTAIGGGVT